MKTATMKPKLYTGIFNGKPITGTMLELMRKTRKPRSTIRSRIATGADLAAKARKTYCVRFTDGTQQTLTLRQLKGRTGLPSYLLFDRIKAGIEIDRPPRRVGTVLQGVLLSGESVYGRARELSPQYDLSLQNVYLRIAAGIPLDKPPRKYGIKVGRKVKQEEPTRLSFGDAADPLLAQWLGRREA